MDQGPDQGGRPEAGVTSERGAGNEGDSILTAFLEERETNSTQNNRDRILQFTPNWPGFLGENLKV